MQNEVGRAVNAESVIANIAAINPKRNTIEGIKVK